MRTTIDIDDDILATAKEIAKKERVSTGAVVSRLARSGFYADRVAAQSAKSSEIETRIKTRNGVPVFPPTGSIVTDQSVRQIREDEGI